MKFATREDIEVPIEHAFELFSDFDQFERSALRRSIDVQRTDSLKQKGVGMTWDAAFKLRSKYRRVLAEMIEFERCDGYAIEMQSIDVTAYASLDLMALSKARTRVSLAVELKPKSLSGRLMVQTLRLGKTRLTNRFKVKSAEFVRGIERQYLSSASS